MCWLLSHVWLFAPPWAVAPQAPPSMGFSRQEKKIPWSGIPTGVGSHALLQGIFLTQGSNLGLLHCRQTLYSLSYQGSLTKQRTDWKRWMNNNGIFLSPRDNFFDLGNIRISQVRILIYNPSGFLSHKVQMLHRKPRHTDQKRLWSLHVCQGGRSACESQEHFLY